MKYEKIYILNEKIKLIAEKYKKETATRPIK